MTDARTWLDEGGDYGGINMIVVAGRPPGQHEVQVELADPTHVITGQTVRFTVPGPAR